MKNYLFYSAFACLVISSCTKEGNAPDHINVPSTYTFENVNYSGQTTRINMLLEMAAYMKTANTSGVSISATTLKNMFSNSSSPFTNPDLNASTKQLKNKCYLLDQSFFEMYMDSIALASTSTVPGSNGVAGVVTSTTDASKKYLFSANGVEYMQIIEKGISGGVFYYQATDYYLSDAQIGLGVDNTTVIPGEGTAMQHHWDEAFGYFAAPVDFPTNTTGLNYWSKYSNTVDPQIRCSKTIMGDFKTGRAAINENNHFIKQKCATEIKSIWDKIVAATIIHYFNEALANFSDNAIRNHTLSEAYAFALCLKYNPDKKITSSQISTVIGYLGSNFYTISAININQAKNLLSSIYEFDAVKDEL